MSNDDILAFAHIGDLHVEGRNDENARDFRAIVDQISKVEGIDFVYVPGDNADNGRPEQYAVVRSGLEVLKVPAHVITGDHDMEGGNLDAFYAGLGARKLPYAETVSGTRCLFLDMCGRGSGGPDFRLGASQISWLRDELEAADRTGQDVALFMHSYPADLKVDGEAEAVANLVHHSRVRLVEMGHTHYNELANDGRTVYAATRSTGQIEEGSVGYAVAAIDRGVVSWRFKELAASWPFVLVTSPADRRLAHDGAHIVGERFEMRALVLGSEHVAVCEYSIDGGPWRPMARMEGQSRYRAKVEWPTDAKRIEVRATDVSGHHGSDVIEPATDASSIPTSRGIGSDADAIGAWPEHSLLGTQLGPNRNGHEW